MTKGRIISALILIGALALAGGSYKFYFSAKLQAYEKDAMLKKDLEAKAKTIADAFYNTKPDVILNAWNERKVSFQGLRDNRGRFFNFADWQERPEYDEESDGIVKYWYEEQASAMVEEFRAKINAKGVRAPGLMSLRRDLGIPTITQYQGRNVEVNVAHAELKRLSTAISAGELLLDSGARNIESLWLWKPYKDAGGLLTYQVMGASVNITLSDLVDFFEGLHASDRYFNLEAIRIKYNTPGEQREPVLNVQFILTQAKYNGDVGENVAVAGAAGAAGAAAAGPMGPGYTSQPTANQTPPPEPSAFDKGWRWFKRNILYMN